MKDGGREGGQFDPPQEKLPSKSPALLGLRRPFLQNTFGRLLLQLTIFIIRVVTRVKNLGDKRLDF